MQQDANPKPNEEDRPQHVHIGAGPFGLGMVVEVCHGQAGLRTVVASRFSNKTHQNILKANQSFTVFFDGDPDRKTVFSLPVHYYTPGSESSIVDLLATPSVSLITTSVGKSNLASLGPLLARALAKRHKATGVRDLCVLACENLPQNSSELRKHVVAHLDSSVVKPLLEGVFFCNTLVDRICAPISWAMGSVDIPIEGFYQWVILAPRVSLPALEILHEKHLIRLAKTETEFAAHEIQKYWCLNGVHLATAAYAYNHRKDWRHFSQALSSPDIARKIKALQDELAVAFLLYVSRSGLQDQFSVKDVEKYNTRVFERLRRNRIDEIGRVLKLDLGTPAPTLSLGTPASILEVLNRVERLVAPQCELLRVRKKLLDVRNESIALHPAPKYNDRLELDDAIQQLVLAMRDMEIKYDEAARSKAIVSADLPS